MGAFRQGGRRLLEEALYGLGKTAVSVERSSSVTPFPLKSALHLLSRPSTQPRGAVRRYASWGRPEVPQDPMQQAAHLRDLNRRGDAEAVIRLYESGALQSTEAATGEYIKALVNVERLDSSSLMGTIQRGVSAQQGFAASGYAQPSASMSRAAEGPRLQSSFFGSMGEASSAGAGAGAAAIGSIKNPLHTIQVEPSFASQLWRGVRFCLSLLLGITVLTVVFEEKGLGRGMLNNPDHRPEQVSNVRFSDVKGVDEAKAELEEIVQYLRNPQKFTTLGGKLPKGVLLVGPPGTGKTMLAKAVAGEAGVPFFCCSGSEFEEMFVGVGARRVRELFTAAKRRAPCIIFLDELDAVGSKRNAKDQAAMRLTLNQLLVEMDGFKSSEGVIVIAATNFPETLDKALVRPGRFDRHVTVLNPDVKGRQEILESHFKNVPRSSDVDLKVIARGTPGFSGADLANLVNVAALRAARDGALAVTMATLEYAKDRILMGAERTSAVISLENRKLTAYHEGGHALVAMYTDGAHPVHKATIVPRGMALGMVMQLPEGDQQSRSRRQLMAELDVCMGGRVAEELIFGSANITTGASSDLQKATDLARQMVTKYGMSDVLGQVSIDYEDDGRSLSSETRSTVESEVRQLLDAAYGRAKGILTSHERDLHTLADTLLEKETLSGKQILDMLPSVPARAAAAVRGPAASL